MRRKKEIEQGEKEKDLTDIRTDLGTLLYLNKGERENGEIVM